MKKLLTLTSLATVATLSMSTLTFANSPQKPEDTNTEVTAVAPSIVIDRTTFEELVPVRTVAESYGFKVSYDNPTQTTTLTKDDKTYTATLGSQEYNINGRKYILETPSQMIEGITYVPKTFITVVEDDLDGPFDFNNPDIDSGFSVDANDEYQDVITLPGEYQEVTTLPAEIN